MDFPGAYFFLKKDSTAKMRKTMKQTFAMRAAVPASEPKPRNPATNAMTMKTMA